MVNTKGCSLLADRGNNSDESGESPNSLLNTTKTTNPPAVIPEKAAGSKSQLSANGTISRRHRRREIGFNNTSSIYNKLSFMCHLYKEKLNMKLMMFNIKKIYHIKKRIYLTDRSLALFSRVVPENSLTPIAHVAQNWDKKKMGNAQNENLIVPDNHSGTMAAHGQPIPICGVVPNSTRGYYLRRKKRFNISHQVGTTMDGIGTKCETKALEGQKILKRIQRNINGVY